MTPTERMQEIEDSRQRLLKNQTSKLSRKLINEVADELQEQEMQKYHSKTAAAELQNADKR